MSWRPTLSADCELFTQEHKVTASTQDITGVENKAQRIKGTTFRYFTLNVFSMFCQALLLTELKENSNFTIYRIQSTALTPYADF